MITLTTVGIFYYYLSHNVILLHQLAKTSKLTLLELFGLFALWFGTIALILQASLKICNLEIPIEENLTLNAYSTFLNYLLPGQAGPVLRGLYLKARHKLLIRRYLYVSLIYYGFYAVISMVLLVGGVRAWWQTLIAVVMVSAGAYFGAKLYAGRRNLSTKGLDLSIENLAYLFFVTCLQAVCQIAIYGVELNSVYPGLKIGQIMSYTGAANFALFVNITPGAIGIREAFLVFSRHLHHVPVSAIVGANILDRSIYIAFLAVILLVLLVRSGKAVFSFRRDVMSTEPQANPPSNASPTPVVKPVV